VTGPDWTTLLGSVALGLTKGVGEGAEMLQRDKAQKMQQQRDAAEQAFRDRKMEREQTRWDADQAYRGRQENIASSDRQGRAWAEQLGGDLTGIDDNVAPDVADAARAYLPDWRAKQADLALKKQHAGYYSGQIDARLTETNERTKRALLSAYAQMYKKDPAGARAFAEANGLDTSGVSGDGLVDAESYADEFQPPWAGNPDYWMNPETNTLEPRTPLRSKIADPRGVPPTVTPNNNDPKDWTFHVSGDRVIRTSKKLGKAENVDADPSPSMLNAKEEEKLERDWRAGEAQRKAADYNYTELGWPGVEEANRINKARGVVDAYGAGPSSQVHLPADQPPAPKTLPTTALDGMDPKVRTLVLSALAGDPVANATLRRQYPGVLQQVIAKRKGN